MAKTAKTAKTPKTAKKKPKTAKKKPKTAKTAWRNATRDDRRAIIAMSQALFVEDPGHKEMTARHVGRTLTVLENEPARGIAVVAEVDGAIVGYALLCSFWSNELHGEVCTVDELFVVPVSRSLGLGTALITALQQGAVPRFRDAVALELEVTPVNRRARALYERLGFAGRKNATMRLLR